MRVITGSARGFKLKTPGGYDVRPTADAVKEAMFSAIQFEIEDKIVLDLFSGTGQLGIEALSRGARQAYFIDSNKESIDVTRYNLEKTGFSGKGVILHQTSAAFLRTTGVKFDLAFLDPPYEKQLIQKSLPSLAEKMTATGIIVCEHESDCSLPQSAMNFSVYKTYKKGNGAITIYRSMGA